MYIKFSHLGNSSNINIPLKLRYLRILLYSQSFTIFVKFYQMKYRHVYQRFKHKAIQMD